MTTRNTIFLQMTDAISVLVCLLYVNCLVVFINSRLYVSLPVSLCVGCLLGCLFVCKLICLIVCI